MLLAAIIVILFVIADLLVNGIGQIFWLTIVQGVAVFVLHRIFRINIRKFLTTAALIVLLLPLVFELILVYLYPLASAAIVESFLEYYAESLPSSIVGAIGGSLVSMVIGE